MLTMQCIWIFLICLSASTIGGTCGIGGGVIIKPLLDSLHIMSTSVISFLSSVSVLSMSTISVLRQRKNGLVDRRIGTLLAIGAILGGIAGNAAFRALRGSSNHDALVGVVQNATLAILTILTLLYSTWLRDKLPSYHVHHPAGCVALGILMGVMSSFLGIGGGPINLAILYFAFSMNTKQAAANSLYIIFFSQVASLITHLICRTIPDFSWPLLAIMVAASICGGLLGSQINRTLSTPRINRLFSVLLGLITGICLYNMHRFLN